MRMVSGCLWYARCDERNRPPPRLLRAKHRAAVRRRPNLGMTTHFDCLAVARWAESRESPGFARLEGRGAAVPTLVLVA